MESVTGKPTRLAASRLVGSTAHNATGQTASCREDRLRPRRLIVDSSSWGERKAGPDPTDRACLGSNRHIATYTNGTPIATSLTGSNRHNVTQRIPLNEAIVPIGGVHVGPRALAESPPTVVTMMANTDASFAREKSPPASRDAATRTLLVMEKSVERSIGTCLVA